MTTRGSLAYSRVALYRSGDGTYGDGGVLAEPEGFTTYGEAETLAKIWPPSEAANENAGE
jgi:hypothetical protein